MALPNGHYEFSADITLGIWVVRNGAWQKVTQVTAYAYSSGQSGNVTINWYFNGSVNLGTGITAFGVTVDSYTGQGQTGWSAVVSAITGIQWTAQGSSGGASSALPGGLKTSVTVRPK
jgi:hypothetical protein